MKKTIPHLCAEIGFDSRYYELSDEYNAMSKSKKKPTKNDGKLQATFQIAQKITGYNIVAEHRFAPPRRWRFDYAILEHKIAIEVEGAVWVNGRHTRGSGFIADMEKYNTATSLGWSILRCVPTDINKSGIWELVRTTIQNKQQ